MATIELYAGPVGRMSGLIKEVKQAVSEYQAELLTISAVALTVSKSVCDLDDVIDTIKASSSTQEQKMESLDTFNRESEEFISETVRVDLEVAEVVTQRKEDFYKQYYYLKPECEKSGWEKFKDDIKSAGEWCREHWKLIVTVVIVIVAVLVLVFCPCGAIIAGACWGAISGAVSGGVIGGLASVAAGRSFWEGFEDGAFSGAITGAIFGGIGGAGQLLGSVLGKSCEFVTKFGTAIKWTSRVSSALSLGMAGFDALALGISLFNPSSSIVELNQKLHSSKLYNAFQITASVVAVFSGGMQRGMNQVTPTCFVAGTMVLTASGLIAIENIKVGDKVIATNPDTLETAEKAVIETYVRETNKLVHLSINGEKIITTVDHPFYVKGHGFVNAGTLWLGAEVSSSNNEIYVVKNIYHGLVDKPIKVYNFQVAEFHTYHVGKSGVLVHNGEYPEPPGEYEKAGYHNKGNKVKSAAPKNAQEALDKSVPIKTTTTRRVSVDGDQFVVFDETSPGVFHGHVRTWSELTQVMKNALVKAGLAKRNGKIL